jgi:mannose-6-phosphate isomerase-like protein (cupin superfamily)
MLEGEACVSIEGRHYKVGPYDCVHVPAGVAHSVENARPHQRSLALYAFGSSQPTARFVVDDYPIEERGIGCPRATEPEFIRRFASADVYELSRGTFFRDLFASRFGAVGICGGYGTFLPGASLPCHFHSFDESITIAAGSATCLVEGRRYELNVHDTAFVPGGRAHRFLNCSNEDMAMLWVYSGPEPERTILDSHCCFSELLI